MKAFQPADHLHSRTFISLLVAQFLAAFNDQAIHASAMFFALNTNTLTESQAISLMPILFYAPWAIFCTVAGFLADRFSKRVALILWKVVEVGITLLALFGFWLGREGGNDTLGTIIVLATVFLMGMHSAFFVPAKYGAMPEILTPRMLSRGNGVLESLSFLAVILGTVAGGVLSTIFRGQEYLIGIILVVLAVIGAIASFFIERIPAANPNRPFPAFVYGPLFQSIKTLLTSRPLVYAVVGIAFFTFLSAYMRQVVYMHGQSQQPKWSEAYTSIIVGMVAVGIGIGSPLAGWLSGGKVEVGLVPFGALGMVVATSLAAFLLSDVPILIICIIMVGFSTGFYLVPLFSLLQHRAPRASKGDSIATSNFINISGAIAASLVFYGLDAAAIHSGFAPQLRPTADDWVGRLEGKPEYREGHPHRIEVAGRAFESREKRGDYSLLLLDRDLTVGEEVVVRTYKLDRVTYYAAQPSDEPADPLYNREQLPRLLFLGAGAMTLFTMLLLWIVLPDQFRRSWIWLRTRFRYHLETAGLLRLPGNGPIILVTDASSKEHRDLVANAVDRVTHFLEAEDHGSDVEALVRKGKKVLNSAGVVGVCLNGSAQNESLLESLLREEMAAVLPVHQVEMTRATRREAYVVAGSLLTPDAAIQLVKDELNRLREDLQRRIASGETLEKEAAH